MNPKTDALSIELRALIVMNGNTTGPICRWSDPEAATQVERQCTTYQCIRIADGGKMGNKVG
jgi:hypothetical protein